MARVRAHGDFYGATYAGPGAGEALSELYGLPSAAGTAAQRAAVDKAHSSEVASQVNAASRDLYALILGVDGGEVLMNRTSFDRKAGKVNVTAEMAKNAAARRALTAGNRARTKASSPGPSRRSN